METLLNRGLHFDDNIISKSEFEAMKPDDKVVGRFYCNFKVHKSHSNNDIPPVRPIVSQSGSICENIAAFVEHHINHIGKKTKELYSRYSRLLEDT